MNEARKILMAKYRKVFLDPVGLEVLADILGTCHFGETNDPENRVRVSEENVAKTILAKMGIFAEGTLMKVIMALAQVMPDLKEEQKEE